MFLVFVFAKSRGRIKVNAAELFVDGDPVYRAGQFTRFPDGERVLREGERIARRALDKTGLRHRAEQHWRV